MNSVVNKKNERIMLYYLMNITKKLNFLIIIVGFLIIVNIVG